MVVFLIKILKKQNRLLASKRTLLKNCGKLILGAYNDYYGNLSTILLSSSILAYLSIMPKEILKYSVFKII